MRLLFRLAAGLSVALLIAAQSPAGSSSKAGDAPSCGNHGTAVDFVDTPKEASKQAKKAGKLVFVLHVSGHFEDPRFT
jgi:hypothetical protein